ncbi:putative 6-oxopurine nucleoside phosphorylase [uncultured archaeon]|nr:putative 6-oxopurine nucleoside phosphorylase [uncultured archaeon]
MLGIIGGTGIYSLGKFRERDVNTPYGFAQVFMGKIGTSECAFIPRHGKDHRYPPHKVNYRANIWALNEVGVEGVLATYAVGIMSKYKPGDLVAAEDFMGFNAPITFYEDFRAGAKHIDFSEPYSKGMRARLLSAAKSAGTQVKGGGIIATTHGPRFETRAEIRALEKMGANLVSMTNAYEATLLHELEIPCAGLCIATNYACGVADKPLSHSEVVAMMAKKEKEVNGIAREFAELS